MTKLQAEAPLPLTKEERDEAVQIAKSNGYHAHIARWVATVAALEAELAVDASTMRCQYTITLRDRSTAQCGRRGEPRLIQGPSGTGWPVYCLQHARIVNGLLFAERPSWSGPRWMNNPHSYTEPTK